jgi:hypothetical protein
MLQAYDFEVKYKPRKANVVADALSRISWLTAISIAHTQLINDTFLKEAYTNDKYFCDIYNTLTDSENVTKKQHSKAKHFDLVEQRLYLKERQHLCIPKDKTLHTTILQEVHDNEIFGHFGVDKTYENVTKDFYWSKMHKEIQRYVSTCNACQWNKVTNQGLASLLQTLNTPSRC